MLVRRHPNNQPSMPHNRGSQYSHNNLVVRRIPHNNRSIIHKHHHRVRQGNSNSHTIHHNNLVASHNNNRNLLILHNSRRARGIHPIHHSRQLVTSSNHLG
jgi:predicted nucleotidyltransferase component of viral defense system